MSSRYTLRTPGPTPLPPEVLEALSRDMVNHRGSEFAAILAECAANLKQLFQTQHDVLMLTGSGTGGLESAVVNLFSPGERILVVSIGFFGERFATIARAFGADVQMLNYEWGKWADPEDVRQRLASDPSITSVLITHNDTSTGVMNDLQPIAKVVKDVGKLLVVDAISSIGSAPLPVDEWGCDVVLTGSQKGWMVPPGLFFVSLSPLAWERQAQASIPRFYWDYASHKRFLDKGATPWTPAVSLFYGLQVSTRMMLAEGLENIHTRQLRVRDYTRNGLHELGIDLVAPDASASWTVTAAKAPAGMTPKELRQKVQEISGITLAGGQGPLEDSVFRIGHLGYVTEDDIAPSLEALARVLGRTPAAARA